MSYSPLCIILVLDLSLFYKWNLIFYFDVKITFISLFDCIINLYALSCCTMYKCTENFDNLKFFFRSLWMTESVNWTVVSKVMNCFQMLLQVCWCHAHLISNRQKVRHVYSVLEFLMHDGGWNINCIASHRNSLSLTVSNRSLSVTCGHSHCHIPAAW